MRRLVLVHLLLAALTSVALALGCASASAAPSAGTWPLLPPPRVVRGFSQPTSPWGAGHRGVDLYGRSGEAVHAALAGRVSFAAMLAGRGVVVIDHGSVRTTYEPVRALVAVGEQVSEGEVIGRLAASPSHCPPLACLHWGLIRGDTYLDPLSLVGDGAVRLVPWDGARPWAGSPAWPGGYGLWSMLKPAGELVGMHGVGGRW